LRTDTDTETDLRSAAVSARSLRSGVLEAGHRLQMAEQGSTALTMPTLVRLGLGAGFEARLASSLFTLDLKGAHPPDVTLGLKAGLLDGDRQAVGILAEARFDFDDRTDAVRTLRFGLLGDLAFSSRLVLRANASALHLGAVSGSRLGFGYAAELAYAIRRQRWNVFAGSSGLVADRTDARLEAGTSVAINPAVLVGIVGGAGLTDAAERWSAALFLRWRL
jgi:hypothetical protein